MQNLDDVFQEAYRLFHSSLPENVKSELEDFQTVEEMNVSTRKQIDAVTDPVQKSRMTKCVKGFRNAGMMVKPYFEIVDIYVQTNPKYLGLVWGSLRLIFKLSANYIEYLEKLSTMFDEMARCLPVYNEYLVQFKNALTDGGKSFPPRLAQSLVNVYVDIIRFCHRALQLFSSKKKTGLRFKTSIIGRLAWKPFDREFEDILIRFERHQELFELEATFATHKKALEFYAKYDEHMKDLENSDKQREREEEATFKANEELTLKRAFDSSVREMGDWVSPPQWKNRYEEMASARADRTGGWILEEDSYVSWRATPNTKPVLCIQGKPGFGKSTLCPIVIDDITILTGGNGPVCYFFFNKQQSQEKEDLAYRSLLVQLLDWYREDSKAIDIAATIFNKQKKIGQKTATENEVCAVLRLLLSQFPGATFVVDAVDECTHPECFLERLSVVTGDFSNCKFAYFTRPTVLLLDSMQENSYILNLDRTQNTPDMATFVQPRMESLIRRKMLPKLLGLEERVENIVRRANGLFLWAKLLVSLLESRKLTVRQRLDALENLNRLEGLDRIFIEITATISKEASEPEEYNIQKAFRWIIGASRPLTVDELQVAIAVPLDQPVSEIDMMSDFEASIGSFSGGLLEVTRSKTVQFIHISAHEFFTTGSLNPSGSHGFSLRSSDAEIQHTIVMTVLSYMVHSLPACPLSGDRHVTADCSTVTKDYPLLEYAATWWSHHVAKTLQAISHSSEADLKSLNYQQFLDLLVRFLYTKNKVLVWLEACWLLHHVPAVCGLPDILPEMLQATEGVLSLVEDYIQLSSDVQLLNKDWSYLLPSKSNEVWGDSVTAFSQSKFWSQGAHSQVTYLSSPCPDGKRTPPLVSQTSKNGEMTSALYLIPPKSVFEDSHPMDPSGWQARYNVWSVSTYEHLVSLSWIVDPSAMKVMLSGAVNGHQGFKNSIRFAFPVSISDDLEGVIALNLVIRVGLSQYDNLQAKSHLPLRYFNLDVFNRLPPRPSSLKDSSLQLRARSFPTGTLIVVFRLASGIFVSNSGPLAHQGFLQLFFDPNSDNPNPRCISSWVIDIPSSCSSNYLSQSFEFHPHRKLIAFTAFTPIGEYPPSRAQTCLLDFEDSLEINGYPRRKPRISVAYDGILSPMEFSENGQSMRGIDKAQDKAIILDIDDCLNPPQHGRLTSHGEPESAADSQLLLRASEWHLQHRPKPSPHLTQLCTNGAMSASAAQHAGSFRFSLDRDGNTQISRLLNEEGAIVLRTLGGDGRLHEQGLSRLPQAIKSSSVPTVVLSGPENNDSRDVKIVLNRSQRVLYTLGDIRETQTTQLPVIVQRSWESITTVTTASCGGKYLEDDRLGDD